MTAWIHYRSTVDYQAAVLIDHILGRQATTSASNHVHVLFLASFEWEDWDCTIFKLVIALLAETVVAQTLLRRHYQSMRYLSLHPLSLCPQSVPYRGVIHRISTTVGTVHAARQWQEQHRLHCTTIFTHWYSEPQQVLRQLQSTYMRNTPWQIRPRGASLLHKARYTIGHPRHSGSTSHCIVSTK